MYYDYVLYILTYVLAEVKAYSKVGVPLQTKLHGSAAAKVPSVGEKQPSPEELWSQKVAFLLDQFLTLFVYA